MLREDIEIINTCDTLAQLVDNAEYDIKFKKTTCCVVLAKSQLGAIFWYLFFEYFTYFTSITSDLQLHS